jgi:hypothetical protein
MTLLKRLEGDLGLFSNKIQGLSPNLFEDCLLRYPPASPKKAL